MAIISQAIERIRGIRRVLRGYRTTGSWTWARLLDRHGIDVRAYPCERRAEGLFFPCLGTVVSGPGESVLLNGFRRAARLHARGVVFDVTRDSVRATIESVSVRVDNIEELLILEEIYLDGIYRFELRGSLLIVDIGMNTAYTALYLAAMHPEAVICAYEPFTPTFRCAEANIMLNPALQSRIRPFPFGLSDADRTMNIEYAERWRGSVGVYGVPDKLRESSEVRVEQCRFRDVATEFGRLYREFPDRRIVLKVDCEGSEYAVLGRLADAGMLDRIDLLMIECHRRAKEHDPGALRASLSTRGFGCVHLQPDSPDISMLYAVKTTPLSHLVTPAPRMADTG